MTTEVSTEALESFKISLDSDDGEGGFHTKNPPRQPFQRETIHHDRSSVNIKCSLLDVAHGKWSPDSNSYATLIVFGFRFEPGKTSRRITSSTITVQFRGESVDDDHPGVADLSLDGSYSLVPSTQEETITSGIDGNINISVLSSGQISLDVAGWQVRVARGLVAELLGDHRCAEDAVLVVSELVANAVLHGSLPGAVVRLRAVRVGHTVYLAVADQGHPPAVPRLVTPATASAGTPVEALGESGRGLWLVHRLARRCWIRHRRRCAGYEVHVLLRPHPVGAQDEPEGPAPDLEELLASFGEPDEPQATS